MIDDVNYFKGAIARFFILDIESPSKSMNKACVQICSVMYVSGGKTL